MITSHNHNFSPITSEWLRVWLVNQEYIKEQGGRQRRGWIEAVGVFVVWPAALCFYPYSLSCSHLCSYFPLNQTLSLFILSPICSFHFCFAFILSVLGCISVHHFVSNKHTIPVSVLVCLLCFVPFHSLLSHWSSNSAAAYWFYECFTQILHKHTVKFCSELGN